MWINVWKSQYFYRVSSLSCERTIKNSFACWLNWNCGTILGGINIQHLLKSLRSINDIYFSSSPSTQYYKLVDVKTISNKIIRFLRRKRQRNIILTGWRYIQSRNWFLIWKHPYAFFMILRPEEKTFSQIYRLLQFNILISHICSKYFMRLFIYIIELSLHGNVLID